MTESAPRSVRGALDRADLAFGLFLIGLLTGVFIVGGLGWLIIVLCAGGMAATWRAA